MRLIYICLIQLKKNIFDYILFRFIPFYRKRVINKIANKKDYYAAFGYMEGRSGTWVADINKKIKKVAWIHNDVSKFNIGISEKEIKDTYSKLDKVICVSKQAKEKHIFLIKPAFNSICRIITTEKLFVYKNKIKKYFAKNII